MQKKELLLLIWSTLLTINLIACDCSSITNIKTADLTFIGKVEKISVVSNKDFSGYKIVFKNVGFIKLSDSLPNPQKRISKKVVIKIKSLNEAACGYLFNVGKSYYVNASFSKHLGFYTDYCHAISQKWCNAELP